MATVAGSRRVDAGEWVRVFILDSATPSPASRPNSSSSSGSDLILKRTTTPDVYWMRPKRWRTTRAQDAGEGGATTAGQAGAAAHNADASAIPGSVEAPATGAAGSAVSPTGAAEGEALTAHATRGRKRGLDEGSGVTAEGEGEGVAAEEEVPRESPTSARRENAPASLPSTIDPPASAGVGVAATQPPRDEADAVDRWLREHLGQDQATSKLEAKAANGARHVLGVAGYEVAMKWRALLLEWRHTKTALQTAGCSTEVTAEEIDRATTARDWLPDDCDVGFVVLYDRAVKAKVVEFLDAPKDRLRKAQLGEKYAELQSGTRRLGETRPQRAVAKEDVYYWLYGPSQNGHKWDMFNTSVKYWKRWVEMTTTLNPGALSLLPPNFRKTYFEQTLQVGEVKAWLQAVRRFRPQVVKLGETVLPLLLAAVRGDPPPKHDTQLEAWDGNPATLHALGDGWFERHERIPQTPPASSSEDVFDEGIDWDAEFRNREMETGDIYE